MTSSSPAEKETPSFAFGKNWTRFLKNFDEDRVQEAIQSLVQKLGKSDLSGLTFLDAGSGSGLFSLAAHRLGAHVISFDVDADCVQCARFLKEKYSVSSAPWTIKQGSVLDKGFLNSRGTTDIVYSWGVLHHTGHMMQALENVASLVKPGGILFISIYNDQGRLSRHWRWVKAQYNQRSVFIRALLIAYTLGRTWFGRFAYDFLTCGNPFKTWRSYGKNNRGMSAWHDLIDWVGGYPFEVATPEKIFDFYTAKGFTLDRLKTRGGKMGCNEFVFTKKESLP